MLALRMAIALYAPNLGFGFEGTLRPLGELHFVSDLFSGETSGGQASPQSTNRLAGTWYASIPSPFPKIYLLGIDLQQRDFEHYGRPSYLRGEWRDHGWWYYYLYAVAIKVPLGLGAIELVGVFTLTTRWFGNRGSAISGESGQDSGDWNQELRPVYCDSLPPTAHLPW